MPNENDYLRFPTLSDSIASGQRASLKEETLATDRLPLKLAPRRKRRNARPGRRNRANDAVIPGACMGPRPANLVKIVVQKPFCAPVRSIITNTPQCPLYKIGIRYWDYTEKVRDIAVKDAARRMKIELKKWENLKYGPLAPGFLPMACEATLWVSPAQARYTVQMVERTGSLYVVKAPSFVNVRKARKWADTDPGKMPKPWYEPTCSEAKNLYGQVGKLVSKNSKKGKKRR